MFSLLLIKFLSLNYRTRLIVGFSVMTAICLLAISVWFNYSSDRLARYLSDDTVIYLWLDRQELQKSWAGTKLIDRVLIENGAGEINKHLLSGQLAQVCLSPRGELNCGLLLETAEPKKMEGELQVIGLTYKQLSKKVFAISHNSAWLEAINKKNHRLLAIRAQHLPWRAGEITLYLQAPQKASSQEAKALSLALANKKRGVFLCGEANGSKLLLSETCFWLTNLKPITTNATDTTADLIISLDSPARLTDNWRSFLSNKNSFDPAIAERLMQVLKNYYSIESGSGLWKKIISAKQSLTVKKTEAASDKILKDYDIDWSLEIGNLSTEELVELEKTLYALLAQETPRETIVYLSDDTKIIELLPDASQIKKEFDLDWVNIKTDNGFQLSYKYKDGILRLTNNTAWDHSNGTGEYFYLKKELFPNLEIFNLIADFQSLSYQNSLIEIY
ncbi:MAG: hypothetical protein BWY53_00557 [Parcubacteria group bacterium ADurb.Bin326]|nr:MAG: hypothetical protein BWY53_00557 [Parcubacteria group bacterium ADurb.Bin326]